MPEVLSEKQIAAEDASTRLFDCLVDDVLGGRPVVVKIFLAGEGDTDSVDEVGINGEPASGYARRLAEWSSTDTEYLDLVSTRFNQKMVDMWQSTVQYYEDLATLSPIMDELAMSRDSGFGDRAKAELAAQGIDSIGDGELLAAARRLACAAFAQLFDN